GDGRDEELAGVLQLRDAQARDVLGAGVGHVAVRLVHRGTEGCRARSLRGGAGRRECRGVAGTVRGGPAHGGGLLRGARGGRADTRRPSAGAEAAVQRAEYRIARANERAAAALFRSQLGNYVPHASLTGTGIAFDNKFYPMGQRFSQLTLAVQFPLWDNFRRETAVSRAR